MTVSVGVNAQPVACDRRGILQGAMVTEADRQAARECANEACRNMDGELDLAAMARHFAIARLTAPSTEVLAALRETMEALAMCEPRTRHGANCQSRAMLVARAAIAKATHLV